MLATDGQGIPLTGILSSASTSEYNLIFPTLDTISIEKRPNHPIKKTKTLIADRGYDAKWVRDELRKRNITPYIPKEENKVKRMNLNTTRRLNHSMLPDGLLKEASHGLATSEELLPDMSIIPISTMPSFSLPVS